MFYLYDFICPTFVRLVKSMSCLSGPCTASCLSGLGVICLVCLACLSFLPTSKIASVLCTRISMLS